MNIVEKEKTKNNENIVPEIGDLLADKKTRYFQTKPILITIIATFFVIAMLLAASQKLRPTIRQNDDIAEKYKAASPSHELIFPGEQIGDAYTPPTSLSGSPEDTGIPPASKFTYSEAEQPVTPPVSPYALPADTQTIYNSSAADQNASAARQQKMEMIRSAYTAKPTVDGNWPRTEITSHLSQTSAAPGSRTSSQLPQVKSPTERMLEYQKIAVGASMGAGGGHSAQQKSAKEQFFASSGSAKGYLKNTREAPISPYTLPSGSMIPCSLISGINSDLPGNITAVVTENVYDWAKPHVCLVPQGSRVFGEYDSNIAFAQKRIQIKWTRLTYPDGSVINLDGMPGVDRRGYTGLKDKFYGHYGRMITAALLTTAIGLIPEWIEDKNTNSSTVISSGGQTIVIPQNNDDFRKTAASQVAEAVGRVGNKYFDKALNVDPTILIRPGTRFNIQVNADIPFYRAW